MVEYGGILAMAESQKTAMKSRHEKYLITLFQIETYENSVSLNSEREENNGKMYYMDLGMCTSRWLGKFL